MFFQGIYTWFYKSDPSISFKTLRTNLIDYIKYNAQGKVQIISNVNKAFWDLISWMRMLFMLPLTFIVDFSRENSRIPPLHNYITPFTLLGFPILVLVHEGLKAFGKVIKQSGLMLKFYMLRGLL